MGMIFYNLIDDELCDLMCGRPDQDDESEEAEYGSDIQSCNRR